MGYNKFKINGVTKIDLTADTVDAAHLYTGYTAHGADGEAVTGTLAPDMVKLLSSTVSDNYDSTTAAKLTSVALGSSAYTSNGILYVRIRDSAGKRNGYFYGSDQFIFNRYPAQGSTTTATNSSSTTGYLTITHRTTSSGTYASYATYTGYGIYGYSVTSAGELTLRHRTHETYAPIINGTYNIDVYLLTGVLADWFGAAT